MVYQNDNTQETYLWIEKENKWLRCQQSEFNAINLLVDMLRNSSDPSILLEQIAIMAKQEGQQMDSLPPQEWDEIEDESDDIYGDPEDWD